MPAATKIMLSEKELAKLTDQEWILTKQVITEKVIGLLQLQVPVITELFGPVLQPCPFPELLSAAPRISKGENYLGLPWVILDYPAVFSKEDIFALRTMFWWGKFMSITLQLSGKYKNLLIENLESHIRHKDNAGLFICVHEEQWQHHFESDNYREASAVALDELLKKPFFKIALKYNLQDWNKFHSFVPDGYATLARFLR